MDSAPVDGIHHVAIVGRKMAAALKFYRELLGLSLVKRTVNPDDPYTPLWIFGDRLGAPGTQLHVLFYPRSSKAEVGSGSVHSVCLRIPQGSTGYWGKRLKRYLIEDGLYRDPDGLHLRLVESEALESWRYDDRSEVSEAYAIRGIHSVVVQVSEEGKRFWEERRVPDVSWIVADRKGQIGFGGVHHLAFCSRKLDDLRYERYYFRSSYRYTPDGLLCEYATEEPGPTLDEQPGQLGERLCLPPWYEERRDEIEGVIRSMK